jgi:hypothetical protein
MQCADAVEARRTGLQQCGGDRRVRRMPPFKRQQRGGPGQLAVPGNRQPWDG